MPHSTPPTARVTSVVPSPPRAGRALSGRDQVGPVAVAWAPVDRRLRLRASIAGLGGPDRARAAALRGTRLRRFVLGRLLVQELVDTSLSAVAGWTSEPGACRRCGEPHGGVVLCGVPGLASVAYSGGLVAAAVAPSSLVSRLGVDLELDAADPVRTAQLRRLLGSSSERVLRRWTRVGAVLKADGRGLLVDPGAVWLRRGGGWIAGDPVSYEVAEVAGPPDYLISLAWCVATAADAAGSHPSRLAGRAGARWSPVRSP